MSNYTPPTQDMLYTLYDVLGYESDHTDRETVEAILDEASKLARNVMAPLNWTGDQHGAKLEADTVTTAPGWKDAYNEYRDGGWNALPFEEEYGGQGLDWALAFPVQEMWQSANMAFGLCPLLNQGAVEAISAHGSTEQKEHYLPNLISGEWTGTMNLTEPQAGSDLGLLRTKAERAENGTYRITGQKIWITYGEHDLTDNIIHLVLARLPDAPDDVKGISLFIVPKFLEDGSRNDVKCVGLDHKLGIHASPTCVMQYGDRGGATAYLIGEEHQGLKAMFTMMNNARLSVGLQGVAIAERACQAARQYASDRIQGKPLNGGDRVTIDHHPDVQNMLLTMTSFILGARALSYEAAIALDKSLTGDQNAKSMVDLLTPIVKTWGTEIAQIVTSLAIQIHGGSGFIEETKVAQYYRDARILPIYEGTNGIQSADLVFRKVLRDGGDAALSYINTMKDRYGDHASSAACDDLETATRSLLRHAGNNDLNTAAFNATSYCKAFGIIACGAFMAQILDGNDKGDTSDFINDKKKAAEFYLSHLLPHAKAYLIPLLSDK